MADYIAALPMLLELSVDDQLTEDHFWKLADMLRELGFEDDDLDDLMATTLTDQERLEEFAESTHGALGFVLDDPERMELGMYAMAKAVTAKKTNQRIDPMFLVHHRQLLDARKAKRGALRLWTERRLMRSSGAEAFQGFVASMDKKRPRESEEDEEDEDTAKEEPPTKERPMKLCFV